MVRFFAALGLVASLLVGPTTSSANTTIVSISDGIQVSNQDIAQFDDRWMSQVDRDGRIAFYDLAMTRRGSWVAWGLGDDARAMVQMYELTHDRKYVDHLKRIADVTYKYRDDQYPGGGMPDYCVLCDKNLIFDHERGAKEAAWGSGLYPDFVTDGGLTPVDAVTSGVFAYPIAALARLVAEDASLQAAYGPAAVTATNQALQTFWVFAPQMDSRQVAGGIEGTINRPTVFPTTAQCDRSFSTAMATFALSNPSAPVLADMSSKLSSFVSTCKSQGLYAGKPFAHNESGSLMMAFIELWRALDTDFYRAHAQRSSNADLARGLIPLYAARHQRYFVNRLQIKNDTAQGQRYWWAYNDDVPSPHTEDAAHGNLDMAYVHVLRGAFDRLNAASSRSGEPVPLDDGIMRRFANTFLQQIARPNEIDAGGNFRGDVDGHTSASLRGDDTYYNGQCDGWGNLAAVDATIWRVCRAMSLRILPPDADGNRQPRLSIANHATLLGTKSFARQIQDVDLSKVTGVVAAGDPFGWVFNPQTGQDLAFRGTNGHAFETWRVPGSVGSTDLSGLAAAPAPSGDVRAYDFPALGTHNEVYRGTDGHLHVLWWTCCAPGHDDLTVLSGAPGPVGNPFPYVSAPFGVQNVVYRSGDGHLHDLYWSTGAVGHDDLTVLSGAAPAAGDPVAYFVDASWLQNVYYRGTDGHVHRLFWGMGAVSHQDLTLLSGAPGPAGDLSAYRTPSGENNVVYRGTDGHMHGLYFSGNGPVGWDDLTWAAAGAPLPSGDPGAYFFAQDGTHHVLYRTSNGHLHELAWTTGAVTHTDLTTVVPAIAAAGRPFGYAIANDSSQHVLYRATDGHLHDLNWTTPNYAWFFLF